MSFDILKNVEATIEGLNVKAEYFYSIRVSSDKPLELFEFRDILIKVKNLFSILLAQPISVTRAFLSDSKKEYPFYFPLPVGDASPFDSSRECFYSFSVVKNNGFLKKALDKCFENKKKNRFNGTWKMVPTLMRFHGLWEQEALMYASILDAYCSSESRKHKTKLDKKLFGSIVSGIQKVFQKHLPDVQGDPDQIELMKSLEAAASSIKNTNAVTLEQKYNLVMDSIDEKIREIIGMSQEEMKLLKDTRNNIAHGKLVKFPDNDITPLSNAESKLFVIFIFFIGRDLGIPDCDFVHALWTTRNRKVRWNKYDEILIEKYLFESCNNDYGLFFANIEENVLKPLNKLLNKNENKYPWYVVLTRSSDGHIEFDLSRTGELRTFVKEKSSMVFGAPDFLEDYARKISVDKNKIKLVNRAHLTFKDQVKSLRHCILIDVEDTDETHFKNDSEEE